MEHVGRNQYLFWNKILLGYRPGCTKRINTNSVNRTHGKEIIPFLEHTTADDCSLPISRYMGRLIMVFLHGTRREKKQIHFWNIILLTTVPCLYVRIRGETKHSFRAWNAWGGRKNTFLGT
jgi:hypothetical protein